LPSAGSSGQRGFGKERIDASMGSSTHSTLLGVVIVVIIGLTLLCSLVCCCVITGALGVYWLAEEIETPPEPTPSLSEFRPAFPDSTLAQELWGRIAETPTTDTDYWLLHGQLESETGDPASREPVREPSEYHVGDVHTFWMSDEEQQRYWQIDAELKIKTDHTYVYVSEGTSFDEDDLQQAADLFESQIYLTNHRYFGSEWVPGIDNDPRMTILVTDEMPFGIAGYFSSADEYPREMKPRSNEREMIYVTSSYLSDAEDFGSLLSHEFQHMIHWNQDFSEATWVNEGLSLLAEEINGYESVLGGWEFWRNPDAQLTNWAEDSSDRLRNYAASKLFLSYLSEHYGGYEILSQLAADDADGADSIDNLLAANGHAVGFVDVFADWTVANLVNDSDVGDGRYGYALRGARDPQVRATLEEGDAEYTGWVRQFGAAWWSNRRNMLSSSLTRQVDLGAVETATLHFWTWYDIETDFDYGYVMASTDDGRTWETLPGTHTTAQDPNNANFGHGYTDKSRDWLEEQVDLSPYAGQEILLRFWYITDPGLNQSGWLIDDIAIPEIGFSDDAEQGDGGWAVEGFIRSSNDLPQVYAVHLVEYGPQTTVRRVELDAENGAEIVLGDETERAVLIVSGMTRWTSEPAPYRVTAEP
jgi:hypothetical protein